MYSNVIMNASKVLKGMSLISECVHLFEYVWTYDLSFKILIFFSHFVVFSVLRQ